MDGCFSVSRPPEAPVSPQSSDRRLTCVYNHAVASFGRRTLRLRRPEPVWRVGFILDSTAYTFQRRQILRAGADVFSCCADVSLRSGSGSVEEKLQTSNHSPS